MSFQFECPNCSGQLEAEEEWAGMETICPHCRQLLRIPGNARQPSSQPLRPQNFPAVPPPSGEKSTRSGISRHMWFLIGGCLCVGLVLFLAVVAGGLWFWHVEKQRIVEEEEPLSESSDVLLIEDVARLRQKNRD